MKGNITMELNIDLTAPEQPSPPTPSEWFDIWIKAVTNPNVDTYQEIARRADVKTAYIWLGIAYLISSLISMVIYGLSMLVMTSGSGPYGDFGLGAESAGLIVVYGCCGVLGYTIVGIAVFSGLTALSNAIAKAFGGVGDFRQLVYCMAAYIVPVSVVSSVIGLLAQIPCVGALIGLLGIAVSIYAVVLNVIAIMAVHQIETWQAIVSSVAVFALILVIVACVVIAILTLMGPTIGNVLSNVIEGMEVTPGY
jgi:hypothetical protein